METTMRTETEILERLRDPEHQDFLGYHREVLVPFLSFAAVQEFLKPGHGITEEEWNGNPVDPAEEAEKYYRFALGKIEGHRGISAERSVIKLGHYAWLMGRDDVVEAMGAAGYAYYGAPKVKAFAGGMGFEWPTGSPFDEMAAGNPCGDDCYECN